MNSEEVKKIQTGHMRHYIKYLRERGKYTVVAASNSNHNNHPEGRKDYNSEVSTSTISNYVRNIKVFFQLPLSGRKRNYQESY